MDALFAWFQGLGSEASPLQVHEVAPATAAGAAGAGAEGAAIKMIPALSDNYMYLIVNNATKQAVAVDPVDSKKMLDCCTMLSVDLVAVLTTHYHSDHSGGNAALAAALPSLEVVAGEKDADRTPAVTRRVADEERCHWAGLQFRCLATPCHTRGHISYLLEGQSPGLFCGDTLFVAGCGRFMEGTSATMKASLSKFLTLPETTRIFCGHEYTVGNLEYALSLEPSNTLLKERLQEACEKRRQQLPTIPSTLAEELQQNPFLRAAQKGCSDEEMSQLRRGKDTFTTLGTVITWVLDVKSFFKPDG
ncbi:unnamed protein product [Durusdinium trenchii]|uniref:hydroxyacylglutathione hydrolase n=2 Tax=Durusdinium trenchii TaxID=1381693 RepID=A0ABP0M1K4_9DINO